MTKPQRAVTGAFNELPEEVRAVVQAAAAKKAFDVVVLDLRESDAFTDFFVICSGRNSRQVQAIVDEIAQTLSRRQARPNHVEGYETAEWVLVDCFDFLAHVFVPQAREFYALERLWGRARRIDAPAEPAARRPT